MISPFFREATAGGAKSTALKPLGWLVALVLPASIGSYHYGAAGWLSTMLGIGAGVSIVSYLLAYFYLLFNDRDAVRSERYSLRKMEIEKGIYGDNVTGIVDEIDDSNLIEAQPVERISSDD